MMSRMVFNPLTPTLFPELKGEGEKLTFGG